MKKYAHIFTILALIAATASVIVAWIVIAVNGATQTLEDGQTSSALPAAIAASIGLIIAIAGYFLKRSWFYGGGLIAAVYFCPSPWFPWNYAVVGVLAIIAIFAAGTAHTEGRRW